LEEWEMEVRRTVMTGLVYVSQEDTVVLVSVEEMLLGWLIEVSSE
jgi:hypothetical protein